MEFTFELNGVKKKVEIPTDWDQVKYRQLLELGDAHKELTAVSVFTGIDEETLRKSNVQGLDKLIAALTFLKYEVPMTQFPKRLLSTNSWIGYKVEQNLEFEPYAVFLDIKEEVEKPLTGMERLKQYPLICAIYITKPYDHKKAEAVAEQLLEAPCTEVLALGNFLLMKLIALNSTINQTSLGRLTLLKRLKLALKGWRTRLAFRVRFFIFSLSLRTTKKPNS